MEEKTQHPRPEEDEELFIEALYDENRHCSYAPDPPRRLTTPPAPKDLKGHSWTVVLLEENDHLAKPRFPFLKKLFGKRDRKGSK
ncbi:MAG: hypothetical protein K2L38_01685 [Dysosmobacter sp.]|nr:hypothetical protein [Dysosmobacter sp.]